MDAPKPSETRIEVDHDNGTARVERDIPLQGVTYIACDGSSHEVKSAVMTELTQFALPKSVLEDDSDLNYRNARLNR